MAMLAYCIVKPTLHPIIFGTPKVDEPTILSLHAGQSALKNFINMLKSKASICAVLKIGTDRR